MEEKKFDVKSFIGFTLLFGILMWMMYSNKPSKEETEANQKKVTKDEVIKKPTSTNNIISKDTSSASLEAKIKYGAFANSSIGKNEITELKNEGLTIKFSNKGGYIQELYVNDFEKTKKGTNQIVHLIKDNNALLNLSLTTKDGKLVHTKDMYFVPKLSQDGKNTVLSMTLNVATNQFLEYKYTIKPGKEYMLDFSIRSQGLENVVDTSKSELQWEIKTYRNEKSVSYENRYTELVYEYEDGKDDYLNATKDSDDEAESVTYVAFKQHLFTSILLTDTPFKKAKFISDNLVDDEKKDTVFTKKFSSTMPLEFKNGALNYNMNMYYGPTKYEILDSYEKNLDEVITLGWGIFGWINRYFFIPFFGMLSSFLPYGMAIIIFTILIRLLMSPITYKSYVSQAKMKVLKPEINALNEKYKDNAMKKQQETMSLYTKAGVNPMAGCLPAFLQLPVFYALFQLFPALFDLRQKSFLWADDLSAYDSVFKLPFYIPLYGDHVSLFPILASVAIFFYMRMTTGDQPMQAPTQEGMPDMAKIMKIMIWVSPIMMLIFFNSNGAGLSLYYFISNTITIGIMLVIKNYIINEDKIKAEIAENKTKPKKEGKFQKLMREASEQAEANKKKKK